ncbi:hypothetical protein AN3545.2 [Aspergillus nidulans FGSC A4]|uniref:NAD(P)-binding protein n=1 Tax=Emericella nidulans (strain FGSC A4 / ATCC 38163 / CBS 112.46 / NRRL 194 / M139) TaxID=227321 RepID=Q5B7D5_EMENI|nr:hypothetical protein [Aspergillus nidulans FGSC A4]EAA59753.1 hypothetical protein AN3545.2 [Aspergillus nidulans FGSC A4]CBF75920.1 TPA: conserved hypothetical protein [Aspergillus nidulans FGSC A4]|eukprot:XP_661149.1 hypothetical protein AN3545.2 [Aspergillus nidulans FGSC A4]
MHCPTPYTERLPNTFYKVTGCSSGISQSLVQLIAKSSNLIIATARNPGSLSSILDGSSVLKLALDVTSIPSIEAALKETLTKFGRIDVLVNNAGHTLVGDTEIAQDKESCQLFDTNFWGMVNITKHVLGIMRGKNPNRGGVILNVRSMGGFIGIPGGSFYHSIYAILSLVVKRGHPAYADLNYPTNTLLGYIGADAYSTITMDLESIKKDLEELKDISLAS